MNNKKILIVTDDFPPKSGGGAAIISSIHALSLKNIGYEVVVITTVEDKSEMGEFIENGIRIIRFYSKYDSRYRSYLSLYNPFLLSKVSKVFKKEKADIIHLHNIHYHISHHAISIARKYSRAVFMTIHDSMPFHYSKLFPDFPYKTHTKNYKVSVLRQLKDFRFRFNPFKNILIRYYLKIPNKIFAVSNALMNALNDNGIGNVEVIHNGIDILEWKLDNGEIEVFKVEHNLSHKKVIMFCGRLSRAKGGELMVKCMSEIIKIIPEAVLLIVGEKDKEALNMLKMAENLNIENKLVFSGKLGRNSIINAYGACDMVVVPSLCFDWFPTVNLEAMVMRKPIVATCFGGSSEIVQNNVNGYIVNPYNKDELVKSIIDILSDDIKSRNFGYEGYKKVINTFIIDRYIEKILYWYNKFI